MVRSCAHPVCGTHTHSTMGDYTYRQKFLEKMYVSSRQNTKVSIVLIALLVEIVLNTQKARAISMDLKQSNKK